jgi:hypothetical protein
MNRDEATARRLAVGASRKPVERYWVPEASQCRWIVNDGPRGSAAPLWCAQPVQAGSPYCPAHHKRCYIKRT